MPKLDISPQMERLHAIMNQRRGILTHMEVYEHRRMEGFTFNEAEKASVKELERLLKTNQGLIVSWMIDNYDKLIGWMDYLERLPDFDKLEEFRKRVES